MQSPNGDAYMPGHCTSIRHGTRGFTLIELMIVVAIVAILVALAYPSYSDYIIKTRRKAGAACLMEAAQYMERQYTVRLSYSTVPDPNLTCETDIADSYSIVTGALTATGYTLTAVPQGAQATRDTKCGTLGINQAGIRTKTGSASAVKDCWG